MLGRKPLLLSSVALAVFLVGPTAADEPELDLRAVVDPHLICPHDQTAVTKKYGEVESVSTTALLNRITHCTPPRMPELARSTRIQGTAVVEVVVNQWGRVGCLRFVRGHPLLAGSAMTAAATWTFRPYKIRNAPVAISGNLVFHFSTSRASPKTGSCSEARW